MTDCYNAIWIVDETFKVVDSEGRVAVGRDCLNATFQLPQFTVDMYPEDALIPVIMSYNPEFCAIEQYIWIE